MHRFAAVVVGGLCLLAVWACSSSKVPPAGRWEGTFEASDVMVAVRLEITPKGEIYLSAPDLLDIENAPAAERPAMRQHLADQLTAEWGAVEQRPLEFDGRVFRKPGGIAPQMEWNPDTKQMTVVLYLGTRPALRVPLRAISEFSTNPWSA